MISVKNITKTFDGYKALDALSLEIEDGSIYGLMGLNGSGKTTLINLVGDYLRPEEGEILIDGEKVKDNETIKQKMIVIHDELYFPRGFKMKQMKKLYASVYENWNESRCDQVAAAFGLPEEKPIHTFSKGMKKQAAFALALGACPQYLVLDEPIDGLDPIVRRTLWHFVFEDVAEYNMTVLVSSHNAREMEDVCDHLGILSKGHLIYEGSLLDEAGDRPVSIEQLFIEALEKEGEASAADLAGRPVRPTGYYDNMNEKGGSDHER